MSTDCLDLVQAKVSKAVEAVVTSSEKKRKNDVLADEEEDVQMQICLKKIPTRNKTSKINLPHSLEKSNTDVCIFVNDLDKNERDYEPTVNHYQELFSEKGVSSVISEIIPLKSLRLEYQPYEAKRNLSVSHDKFLADERILKFLPRLLGRHFFGEKKNPVQVNLRASDLKKEFDKALNTCRCTISGRGSSSMVVVGHTGMSQEDITENIVALGKQLAGVVPGGIANIKQLHLKAKSSVSVPIYMNTGGPQEVTITREKMEDDDEAEEVSTVIGAKVKVFRDGRVLLIKDGETEKHALESQRKSKLNSRLGKRKKLTPKQPKSTTKKQKKSKSAK